MIAYIAALVGQRAAKPVFFGFLVVLLIIVGLIIGRCSRTDTTAQQQAKQTTRSSDAIANAAQNAIETIDNRTVTEADVDTATAHAQRDIDNAQTTGDIRNAVLAGVCGQASHSHDPACAMR
jgi:hypothetical protein